MLPLEKEAGKNTFTTFLSSAMTPMACLLPAPLTCPAWPLTTQQGLALFALLPLLL